MKSNADQQLLKQRFEAKIAFEPNTGCWLWAGETDGQDGYGRMKIVNRLVRCNRISMFLYKGGNLLDDRYVLHHCDVRLCVNPDHLYFGTPKNNIDDMDRRGRRTKLFGSDHQNSKLNETYVRIIKEAFVHGFTNKDIATYFRISRGTIYSIRVGKTWVGVNSSCNLSDKCTNN